jgi:hypothetical protein
MRQAVQERLSAPRSAGVLIAQFDKVKGALLFLKHGETEIEGMRRR